jgi:hypothetical protein
MPEFRVRYEQVITYEVTVKAGDISAATKKVAQLLDDGDDPGLEIGSSQPAITEVIDPEGRINKPMIRLPANRSKGTGS